MSIYDYSANTIGGKEVSLEAYKDKVILIVNTASKCGFTPQFEGLENLYKELHEQGLEVLGFPCNQFGSQEPGNSSEIEEFCQVNYGVSFLITEKIDVKGTNQHPLYSWLTSKDLNDKKSSKVRWNFQKYLVDDKGKLVDYYLSITKPTSSKITKHLK